MTTKAKRSIKNFLVDKNFQLKYAFYFSASGLLLMSAFFMWITQRLNSMVAAASSAEATRESLETTMARLLYDISFFTVMTFVVVVIFSFLFAIYMTHRVAGPARVIQQYIQDLSEGRYDSQRSLRKNDELQEIMTALKELAAKLKSGR